jgi:prepilin-type N-terminal cleavage/methylation domain-containing protein
MKIPKRATLRDFSNGKSRAGFTLIELLVVIAIIGILSAIVLASLNFARGKGNNAAVQSSLEQLRTQTSLYYNTNGNYGTANASGSCTTANTVFMDSQVKIIINQIQSNTGNTAICSNNSSAWALSAKLPQAIGSNNYACIDAGNIIKYYATSPGNMPACP